MRVLWRPASARTLPGQGLGQQRCWRERELLSSSASAARLSSCDRNKRNVTGDCGRCQLPAVLAPLDEMALPRVLVASLAVASIALDARALTTTRRVALRRAAAAATATATLQRVGPAVAARVDIKAVAWRRRRSPVARRKLTKRSKFDRTIHRCRDNSSGCQNWIDRVAAAVREAIASPPRAEAPNIDRSRRRREQRRQAFDRFTSSPRPERLVDRVAAAANIRSIASPPRPERLVELGASGCGGDTIDRMLGASGCGDDATDQPGASA